jgi:hypothetical protein
VPHTPYRMLPRHAITPDMPPPRKLKSKQKSQKAKGQYVYAIKSIVH